MQQERPMKQERPMRLGSPGGSRYHTYHTSWYEV
jgi:hypothetical protein